VRRFHVIVLPALVALAGLAGLIYVSVPGAAMAEPQPDFVAAGRTMIVSVGSGKCADASTPRSQVQIYQYTCHGRNNQRWIFKATRDRGEYLLTNVESGLCLDVFGNRKVDGTKVIQAGCHGRANQRWRVDLFNSTEFSLVSVSANRCLDVNLASKTDGAGFVVWPCHRNVNQRWVLSSSPRPDGRTISRAEVLDRARTLWGGLGSERVPYSQSACYDTAGRRAGSVPCQAGTYRADCAGYVAMAWNTVNGTVGSSNPALTPLAGNPSKSRRIAEHDLLPGDALAYYRGPGDGAHIALFVRWADRVGGRAIVWEQRGGALGPRESIWSAANRRAIGYQAFRYDNIH
jgi:Ricin-type beta-trefoil lectin domain